MFNLRRVRLEDDGVKAIARDPRKRLSNIRSEFIIRIGDRCTPPYSVITTTYRSPVLWHEIPYLLCFGILIEYTCIPLPLILQDSRISLLPNLS